MAACGHHHTVVVARDGSVWTWGRGDHGQLGHRSQEHEVLPVRVGEKPAPSDRTAGSNTGTSKMQRAASRVVAANSFSRASSKTSTSFSRISSTASTQAGPPSGIQKDRSEEMGFGILAVTAGARTTIAVDADGSLWTWGGGGEGQLGRAKDRPEWNGTPSRLSSHVFGGVPAIAAASGDEHSLGLTADGRVWVWGSGREAQQGTCNRDQHLAPVPLPSERFAHSSVVCIAAGDDHSVVFTAEGDIFSWGRGAFGRLGHNDELDRISPTLIARDYFLNSPAVAVAAGKAHTAVITSDGNLWLWGWNEYGQLGSGQAGPTTSGLAPARLEYRVAFEDFRVNSVSCGGLHTLAMTESGALWSWGRGVQAQLGHNDRLDRCVPTRVSSAFFADADVTSVAAGLLHSAALTEDGRLWTWGAAVCDTHDPPKPTGLGHADLRDAKHAVEGAADKLVPTPVATLVERSASIRCPIARPGSTRHALVYSMASRQNAGNGLDEVMDDMVQQMVEIEDSRVRERRSLTEKQKEIERQIRLRNDERQSAMYRYSQEESLLSEMREEEARQSSTLLDSKTGTRNSSQQGSALMALGQLSADIARHQKKMQATSDEIQRLLESAASANKELREVRHEIELKANRADEGGDDNSVRHLLTAIWCLSLRSAYLGALSLEERRECCQIEGECPQLGEIMIRFSLLERASLLSIVSQSTHAVLLAAEREAENRQREALAHNRRTIENQLARAASCARQQAESVLERERAATLGAAPREREPQGGETQDAAAEAGWSGEYQGGSVPHTPSQGNGFGDALKALLLEKMGARDTPAVEGALSQPPPILRVPSAASGIRRAPSASSVSFANVASR